MSTYKWVIVSTDKEGNPTKGNLIQGAKPKKVKGGYMTKEGKRYLSEGLKLISYSQFIELNKG